jgi:acyl-CoA synthetase (AMP-forming)/AMP-acid ligase II
LYVVDKIYQHARDTPAAPAIIYNAKPTPYADFYRMIMAMRRSLASRGLKPGSVAALRISFLPVAWVANLALRTLGLTTVSLRTDNEFAACAGLDIGCVITFGAERPEPIDPDFAPGAPRIIITDADWQPGDDPGLPAPPATTAGGHILLTSATTGRYKMVLLPAETEEATREAGVMLYLSSGDQLRDDSGALCVNLFDFGLWTAGGYATPMIIWSRGGAVVFHQSADIHRPFTLPQLTHALAPPIYLVQLMKAPPGAFPRNDDLQIITVGGTPSMGLLHQVQARLTRRVATTLGSTESGSWAITPIETEEDLRWNRLHPSRVVEVVDEQDRPLPPGELGQVRVLLDNGLEGYLNDADATAQAFRGGYFYPGDLGILDGSRRLALYGRVTAVLNVLGEKRPALPVELAVEKALGVDGVCALSDEGPDLSEELHIVIETPEKISPERLRPVAERHLSQFPKVHFHFVERLPRNDMGKVQRFKLQQMLIEKRLAAMTPV